MGAFPRRSARSHALLIALLVLLVPWSAWAGKRSMIPPGQEQRIRQFVEAALAAAHTAGELPEKVDEQPSIQIDRDRIRVILGSVEHDRPLPRLVVFHPDALDPGLGVAVAPGITLECGPIERPGPCPESTAAAWASVAERLATARDPWIEQVWQIEETGVRSHDEAEPARRSAAAVWIDRGVAIATVTLGLIVVGFAIRHAPAGERPKTIELAILLGLLTAFVGATASFTNLVPLHEHNSFVARSDCAIDPRCVEDPAAAWSMTTIHGYGLLLESIPYRVEALAKLSLAVSTVMLTLLWALTRRLAIALGRSEWASAAGLGAVAVLVSNPVFWRLSGAATFWPWTLSWTLAAALAGLWAAQACASERRRERLAGAAAWTVAAMSLAFAAAGNVVCLTLGVCLLLAPACWSRRSAEWSRALWIGLPAIAGFALLVAPDYRAGVTRVFGPSGFDDSTTLGRMWDEFNPLLLDPRIVTPVWALAVVAASLLALGLRRSRGTSTSTSASTIRALRLLAPLAWAYLVPAAFLGEAASEVIGSGYPSGFLNHHWELVFTAIPVALTLAWLADSLARLRPLPGRLRWTWLLPGSLTMAALLLAPLAREGWRMATGELVVERELVALERSFASLPEHDLLVVAPRLLAPLTDSPSRWDPLEVVFPVGGYEHALRERGLEPGLVVSLDRLPPPRPGERILLYVGSSLRSFQPHEIADARVPDDLERPDLARLRDDWALEPVLEFVISTEQHEAASQRLGADRVSQIELGFFWMRPHS